MAERTILEAIIKVMEDSGRALTPKEVYRKIRENRLYQFKAQNPLGVVANQIRRHSLGIDFPSSDRKKYFKIDHDGRFIPLTEPVFCDRKMAASKPFSDDWGRRGDELCSLDGALIQIRRLQDRYNAILKKQVISDLKSLTPTEFEHFSRKLLGVYGFEDVVVTRAASDGGIDGRGRLKVGLSHMNVAFQSKRWKGQNIQRKDVDEFRGAIQGEYEQGIYFTTSAFSKGAKQVSIKPGAVPIVLVDGESIVDLMIDRKFGIEAESITVNTYAIDTILAEEDSEG